MKIKSISFRNFKYVPKEREIKLNLNEAESLILGGPNGYGKTTVFDALELLITGTIRHFNANLLNRGKESLSVLANNPNYDICVAAEFMSDNDTILIERKFLHNKNFTSVLTKNNEKFNDEELFQMLGIRKNLFELGIYISQMDSLNFLQQKYKDRKESITDILDSTHIENRLNEFKQLQEAIKNKFAREIEKDEINLSQLDDERLKTRDALNKLILSQEDIPYVKLFDNKDYTFDKENFGKEDTYDAIISPIDDLIEFSKYKKDFSLRRRNNEINQLIAIDKKVYIALFFNKEIIECINKKQIIIMSDEFSKLKTAYQEKRFYLNESIINTLEITTENTQKINELLSQKDLIEKNMNETQDALSKILKQRAEFLLAYEDVAAKSILSSINCPLCGRQSDKLIKLFSETETVLKSNLGSIATQLTNILNELANLFQEFVIPKVDDFLNLHHVLIEKNRLLSTYLKISTVELSDKLKSENIVFENIADDVNFSIFEEEFLKLNQRLIEDKKDETAIITEELYNKLLRISRTYYTNFEPYDEKTLQKKKFYISSIFSNSLSLKSTEIQDQYIDLEKQIKEKKSRYDVVNGSIVSIISKINVAKKQYQTSIVENIALPMYIFSGKIIQNYPLGLGILIQVKDNAVVFKTRDMESDIFNNLSTGQLNGVVISLLLAIKETFTTDESLNTLLIDDPLQTIDEISAISLIDLLAEHFDDTQIILSTHEDDKQFLLKKKYEQSGKRCQILNMHEEYLKQ